MDCDQHVSVSLVQDIRHYTLEFECPICYETKPVNFGMMSSCRHLYCSDCIGEHVQSCLTDSRTITCPLCRSHSFCLETTDAILYAELNDVLVEYAAWKYDDQIYMAFLFLHFPDYN